MTAVFVAVDDDDDGDDDDDKFFAQGKKSSIELESSRVGFPSSFPAYLLLVHFVQ